MALRILCSGFLVRHPVGGHTWHHLQYLVGFKRLGHEVMFVEDFGWPDSCYDPAQNEMTSDPAFGLEYLRTALQPHGLADSWCYLAEDGQAHGKSRPELESWCETCDVYFNLSNINWIPQTRLCKRRAMIDTDPVFTQIGGHGCSDWSQYDVLFTYGENVGKAGCDMPTGGAAWLPTRQPIVLDLWPVEPPDPAAPFTSVMNWSAYGERRHNGRVYGQKDREFEPYFSLPRQTNQPMELAINAPPEVSKRLCEGGWRLADPLRITRTPRSYQQYLAASRAEFCVAKHAYVSTRCGWFSDRTAGYLAMGRPVIVQDTGFSRFLPCGKGLLPFTDYTEAVNQTCRLTDDYENHCTAAHGIANEFFNSDSVLRALLSYCL